MFKRRTSRVQHRRQVIELQANVVSPRIVWFGLLKNARRLIRFAVILAVLGAAVWWVNYGIRRGVLENEKFSLQEIKLTPNPVLDERGLVNLAGIDLSGTLFDCDSADIQAKLRALPAVESATVRREFPGTLVVSVKSRVPCAWVAQESAGILARDPEHGLLVDDRGIAFSCPEGLLAEAVCLPVFELGSDGERPLPGQPVSHPEYSRLKRLYRVACSELPGASEWIDTLRQTRSWSMEIVSRDGTSATFGLGDHERQMADFRSALEHARDREQQIVSIELIPERNIPVVLHGEGVPRAILLDEPSPAPGPARRSRDLQNLLNR